jgi:nucleoside diphosphate kinase
MKAIQDTNLITDHTIDIYDSSPTIAAFVGTLQPRKVRLFTRSAITGSIENVIVHEYLSPTAASMTSADVCMLDGSSLKVLAVRYPSDAQYILARLALRSGWILGIPGILRRRFLGRVKFGGVVKLKDAEGCTTNWLLINKTKKTVPNPPLLLPKSVGPVALFDWMRKEKISYVVPRFYENLPKLHRDDGDLDLIVADDDAGKVVDYLRSLEGELTGTTADSIPIGMHTVSLGKGVPYYPPPLARQILERAIGGPAGSRIPEPVDAFNAFVYHVLYHHKGYATNVPSTLGGKSEHPPENDYGAIIQDKATMLGISVGKTMEDMDEYMAEVGWRPKRDTLAKIAEKNVWVRDRFFSEKEQGSTGLAVFVIKERAIAEGLLNDITKHMEDNGLRIVKKELLSEEAKKRATADIRGGNWVDSNGSTLGLLPAALVVAIDPHCVHLPPAYAGEYERIRVKKRKEKLRQAFDIAGEASLIHSADNTVEAWEYIEVCFPEQVEDIRKEVEEQADAGLLVRLSRWFSFSYLINATRFFMRDLVTKHVR